MAALNAAALHELAGADANDGVAIRRALGSNRAQVGQVDRGDKDWM